MITQNQGFTGFVVLKFVAVRPERSVRLWRERIREEQHAGSAAAARAAAERSAG